MHLLGTNYLTATYIHSLQTGYILMILATDRQAHRRRDRRRDRHYLRVRLPAEGWGEHDVAPLGLAEVVGGGVDLRRHVQNIDAIFGHHWEGGEIYCILIQLNVISFSMLFFHRFVSRFMLDISNQLKTCKLGTS